MNKGNHLLIDCRNVPLQVCSNDAVMLKVMASAAERAGATVISQVRYRFGYNSPPGFTAVIVLDESHCSCHSYSAMRIMALDVFTCGKTDPAIVLKYIREELDLGDVTVKNMPRFEYGD